MRSVSDGCNSLCNSLSAFVAAPNFVVENAAKVCSSYEEQLSLSVSKYSSIDLSGAKPKFYSNFNNICLPSHLLQLCTHHVFCFVSNPRENSFVICILKMALSVDCNMNNSSNEV